MNTTQDTVDEPWTPSLLDPRTIHPHPMNPRTSSHADEGLIASVKEMGVLERLVLAPVPADLPEHARGLLEEDADFLLIAGHRRLDAAVAAGLDLVPVDVRHDLDTLEKQLSAIAAENVHRSDLTALEEGDLYLALGDLGLTQKAISDRTSVDKGRVSERTRVAKLPATAREKLASHQITLEAALTLAKVADDPDQVARIATQPPYVWDQEVRRVLAAKERAREDARTVKDLAAAGVIVLDEFPPTPDIEDDDPDAAVAPWRRLDDLLDACYDRMSLAVVKHHGLVDDDADEYEGVDLEFEQIETWHQATCTGHAVVRTTVKSWEGESTRWVAICTTPAAHDDLLDVDETPAGLSLATDPDAFHTAAGRNTPDEAEDRQPTPEQQAEQQALDAAAKTRRVWLAKLLEDTNRASGALWRLFHAAADGDGAVSRLLVALGPSYASGPAAKITYTLLEGLGVPEVSTSNHPGEVIAAWANKAPEASSLPRLALAAIIGSHAAMEHHLATERREWKSGNHGYCVPWIRILDIFGYPWTPQELEWLDRIPAETTEDVA